MPQRSSTKKVSSPKALQFHQVVNARTQQSKQSAANQRVLILSTPIKLKDGSVNIEQRAIPLRLNEDQLMMSGGTKNNVISLKRSNEPPPLALPINQLNKKSPTFVKNEVGQVLGKLIPLGKFSNITSNTLNSVTTMPTSPVSPVKNLKRDIPKQYIKPRESKLAKLIEDTKKITDAINENAGMKMNLKSKAKPGPAPSLIPLTSAKSGIMKNTISTTVPNVRRIKTEEPITTMTSTKPKKQVHLVLKGDKNMASIGQTGRNIKLIPLDQWKLGTKLNVLKTMTNSISQPKIIDVRSCAADDIKNDPPYFDTNKLSCIIKEEDFSLNDILEKDPLDFDDMSMMSSRMDIDSEVLDTKPKFYHNTELELKKSTGTLSTSKCLLPVPGNTKPSGMITLMNGTKAVRLKINNKTKTNAFWSNDEKPTIPKKEVISLKSNQKTKNDVAEIRLIEQPTISVPETTSKVMDDRKSEDKHELHQRIGAMKSKMTPNEAAMMQYIQTLRRRLTRCEKSKVRLLEDIQQRHSRGMTYLTNTQRRFIELQLRNSKNLKLIGTQWFTKMEILMAQRVLEATGPVGYCKLRKLFSLPSRSVVAKVTSKT